MKDGLIFYISQYEAIKSLTDEQLGRLYRAIFEKQLGNEVVLEDDIKIAFNFINNQMVVDNKKYMKKVETLRNNGKKGGAPLGNHNAKKQQNNQNNQIEKKTTLNEKENENVNVNDIDNMSIIYNWNNQEVCECITNKGEVCSRRSCYQINGKNYCNQHAKPFIGNLYTNRFVKPTLEEIQDYCLERNNSVDAEKFYDFYESKDWMIGKNKMKDWKACVRTWERRTPKQNDVPSWFNQELKEKELTDEQKRMYEELMGNN